jgi:hypothetical protein
MSHLHLSQYKRTGLHFSFYLLSPWPCLSTLRKCHCRLFLRFRGSVGEHLFCLDILLFRLFSGTLCELGQDATKHQPQASDYLR